VDRFLIKPLCSKGTETFLLHQFAELKIHHLEEKRERREKGRESLLLYTFIHYWHILAIQLS